jgi:L-lactate dehydrogenase complex protein LldF
MSLDLHRFRKHSRAALADKRLQQAIVNAAGKFSAARQTALADLPFSDQMRNHLKEIRQVTLANLADHLETFEHNAGKTGVQIHWARSGEEACGIVVGLAQERGITHLVKSKSMVTEEIRLNTALEKAGINPVETDLGEWIVQLAGEPPSHIIAPAVHKTKEQVADLFSEKLGNPVAADIPSLTAEARKVLRNEFLTAEMGISGGNLLVAETGSLVLVTNEGNGRLVTSLPRIHVAVVGIEKVVPTWEQAEIWLSLLARSATGQPLSIYTNIITGPAKKDDLDGPQEVHIVLLDNLRSSYMNTAYEEMFNCIRCGACLNVCQVYRSVGGHAYGSPYSGPMGAVLTPLLFGMENYPALPQASTLCGACLEVCPVRIDLPRMLLEMRRDQVAEKRLPFLDHILEKTAGWVMGEPGLFRILTRLARLFGGTRLLQPFFTASLPKLSAHSFQELWERGEVD